MKFLNLSENVSPVINGVNNRTYLRGLLSGSYVSNGEWQQKLTVNCMWHLDLSRAWSEELAAQDLLLSERMCPASPRLLPSPLNKFTGGLPCDGHCLWETKYNPCPHGSLYTFVSSLCPGPEESRLHVSRTGSQSHERPFPQICSWDTQPVYIIQNSCKWD